MTDSLAAALVAALGELTTIEAGRTADAGSYKYDYADLGDIVRLTRPVLAQHGVVALTPLGAHDDRLAVSVHLIHTSGESLVLGPFPFSPGRDAQATGSMVTYMRRYALLAALGMATGDDDDGAKASAPVAARAAAEVIKGFEERIAGLGDNGKASLKAAWPIPMKLADLTVDYVDRLDRALAALEPLDPPAPPDHEAAF